MLTRIRERKLVQWLLGYAAAAFVLLQGLELVVEGFPAFTPVLQVGITLAVMGLPMVLVIGWFHGEKGRQRVQPLEIGILAVLVAVTGFTVYRVNLIPADPDAALLVGVADAALDGTRYAILPFRRDGTVPELNEDVLLHDALARWREIDVVEPYRVRETLAAAGAHTPQAQAKAAVSRLGAGRLVTGEVALVGSMVRIQASLLDARRGQRLAQSIIQIPAGQVVAGPRDPAPALASVERLAADLLFHEARGSGGAVEPDSTTRSYRARLAFLRAEEAVRQWDLGTADSLLAEAVRADPSYPRALLWQAQVRNWNGQHSTDLLGLVEAAVARRDELGERDRLLAEALLHLGREDYTRSCAAYERLRQRDERDFAAWYGLGECRLRDVTVVRDAGSPSGWAFRSSGHRGVAAYRRAFELNPSVHRDFGKRSFDWLDDRLRLTTGSLRVGSGAPPDTMLFLARTAWLADSLAFVPYPASSVYAGGPGTRPATHLAAVERQRWLFLDIAESWARAFPESPDALEALAVARELVGDPHALGTLDSARALSESPSQRLRLAAAKAKLLVKLGSRSQLLEARALADTLVAAAPGLGASDAALLAPIAALIGRASLAASLSQRAAETLDWRTTIPVAVTGPVDALVTYAAFGAPVDSIAAYEALAEAVIEHRIAPADRDELRTLLLVRPASLAYDSRPLERTRWLAERRAYRLLQAQAVHRRGDAEEARRILLENRQRREQLGPAELALDAVYPEAALWLALSDTTSTVNLLESSLNALRWTQPGSLGDAARAASLVRTMALRAELAHAAGDVPTATRWADAVSILWSEPDEALRPIVRRLSMISDPAPPSVRR